MTTALQTLLGWTSLALVLLAGVAAAGLGVGEFRRNWRNRNKRQYAVAAGVALALCVFVFVVLFLDQFGNAQRSGPNFIANLIVTILLILAALGCVALCLWILKDDTMSFMWLRATAAFSGAVACAFVAATAWLYGSDGTHPDLDHLARFVAGGCILLAFLLVGAMALITILGVDRRHGH